MKAPYLNSAVQEPEINLYTMRNVAHVHPRQEAKAHNKAGDARLQPFFPRAKTWPWNPLLGFRFGKNAFLCKMNLNVL
jgi:hypothetical protein